MTREQKLMIDALCVAVAGQQRILEVQNVDWGKLQRFSQRHALAPMVCDGLQKAGVWDQVPGDVQNAFQTAYMKAIYRDAQMEYTRECLQEALLDASIPHIFLKGTVLKNDYPVPALRIMSDMDLLIREEDYEALDRVAKKLEAVQEFGDGNHKNYAFPGNVLVEFHPNFLHHASRVSTLVNPGWQYAEEKDGKWHLTEEGFYLFHICHLADHFTGAGMGVRFILDTWVLRHLRKTQPDRAKVESELERFGILDFTRNIEALAETWFSGAETTPLMDELGEYVLSNGVFGTLDQSALNEVSLAGNRRKALLKRVFYPRAEMESRYPWCKGKPILLPVAWFARAFTAVRLHSGHIRTWSKGASQAGNAEIAAQKEKMARFGIRGK